jgi:tetratricopeptide (TPR) repeat protein
MLTEAVSDATKEGINVIQPFYRLICRNRKSLFALAFMSFFLISATSVRATIGDGRQKESILTQARSLMDKDETNRSNMMAAASMLEQLRTKFPDEIRIPLYLAEAYYRMADPEEDVAKTYPYFEKTEFYSREVLKMDQNRIEAHYWYGLFLLRKAQHVSIFQAYFVAKQGIAELEKVRQMAQAYDHGGASRVLGLLYAKAPGWSPLGDMDKAVRLAEEATSIDPDYLLNRVYLAEAYQKLGQKDDAIRECRKILSVPSSRNPFEKKVQGMLLTLE